MQAAVHAAQGGALVRRVRNAGSQIAQGPLEPVPLARLLGDEAVFMRTVAGQGEVIFDRLQLSVTARRLLLLVNGETPLRVLLDLLHLQDESVASAVLQLIGLGLVELRPGEDGL